MPESAESVQDDANTGTDTGNAKDQDMIPRARLNEALGKVHHLETELAEMRGRIDGLQRQGSNGGGEKVYTDAELDRMVSDEEITEGEASRYRRDRDKKEIQQTVRDTVREEISSSTKISQTEQEIGRYTDALPDVLQEGTETREKYSQELRWLMSRGEDPKNAETILRAMRAAFGDADRLNIKPGKGKRDTVQDTNAAGEDPPAAEDKTPRWPAWMDETQRTFYQKQIDNGYYKDRNDCLERIKPSEETLKRGAARRAAGA